MHVWPARRVGRLGVRGGEGSGEGGREGGLWTEGGVEPTQRFHLPVANAGEVCVFALDGAGKV